MSDNSIIKDFSPLVTREIALSETSLLSSTLSLQPWHFQRPLILFPSSCGTIKGYSLTLLYLHLRGAVVNAANVLAMNVGAWVQIPAWAVNMQPTQLFILSFSRETLGR